MKKLLAFLAVMCAGPFASAAQYHVMESIGQGVTRDENFAATEFVRNAVSGLAGETVVEDQLNADFVLQPRLMKLGESYILTVEKRRGNEVVYASQLRADSIDQLDQAAQRATVAAVSEEQATRGLAAEPGTGRLVAEDQTFMEALRENGNWFVGLGPSISRNLDSDNVMYHLTGGYRWDVAPAVQLKALGEASIATGSDSTQFYNLAVGGNWFFMHSVAQGQFPTSPYVLLDLGVGTTENDAGADSTGLSVGTGIGFQFFRQAENSVDVVLRYALIADEVEGESGFPAVIGASVAYNF